ncbi:MAG: pseudouridine synthase [Lachnospiraceae bacterium]|nr:pseudouridine synthase [Lachnospiraceae bacterium]MBR5584105.1 pseudouridine synthase [Lachnospiraceae bacterium]
MYSYYMFHKPYGCVCARKDDLYPTVMDYFKELNNPNLSNVGRLDRETEGLLMITDDGKWNQLMTHPSNEKEKLYEFIALGTLNEEKIQKLETGVLLKGATTLTAPARVSVTGTSILSETLPLLPEEIQKNTRHNRPEHPIVMGQITITEGKKHQVRRMLKTVGCCIIYLKRISMGDIVLDETLKPGEWKEIKIT